MKSKQKQQLQQEQEQKALEALECKSCGFQPNVLIGKCPKCGSSSFETVYKEDLAKKKYSSKILE